MVADLYEWEQIVDNLPLAREYWKDKAAEALGGVPNLYGCKNGYARNIQFELYAAACLRKSGIRVVEPNKDRMSGAMLDCEIEFEGMRIGVEAKRISSWEKRIRRVEEAQAQLIRAKTAGIVFLDVSWAQYQMRSPQEEIVDENSYLKTLSKMQDSAYSLVNELHPHLNHDHVLGVWVYSRRGAYAGDRYLPVQLSTWVPVQITEPRSNRHRLLSRLILRWGARELNTRGLRPHNEKTPAVMVPGSLSNVFPINA